MTSRLSPGWLRHIHVAGPDRRHSQQRLAELIASILEEELAMGEQRHPNAPLRRYYARFLEANGRVLPVAAFAYVQRLWPLVERVASAGSPPRLLDAGCGYGTEAYLAALLGADVTAVDVVPERIAVAEARRPHFAALADGDLSISFHAANVLTFLQRTAQVDLIWAMEAISHIHPPDEFFARALSALRPGGVLLVSDPNLLNPLAWLRSVAIRGSLQHRTHRRFNDPETGEPIDYGQEHITSVLGIHRALGRAGFTVERTEMSGFMGTTLLPRGLLRRKLVAQALVRLGGIAHRLPWLRYFGTVYTVAARKVSAA